MVRYSVQLEVAGPLAMFARPDTGATPISYPVPTWSAAKGMFDAVAWRPHVYLHPTRVEICRPIRYERYVTNYGGPLRKRDQITNNNNYQLQATVLADVCYRISGEVRQKKTSTRGKDCPQSRKRRGQDWRPRMWELFQQRLMSGQTYYTPCLGWKEFVPSYFGALRERDEHGQIIEPDRSINLVIPSLLHSMWEDRRLKPVFKQDWHISNGVMSYVHQKPLPEVQDA
jgi:CRISPR-associated protein Cas5d